MGDGTTGSAPSVHTSARKPAVALATPISVLDLIAASFLASAASWADPKLVGDHRSRRSQQALRCSV